ncbi:hypothetical protein AX15_003400 [Amanita polypyramis BW_CC]|nr:hypothetical protein AX15_003400 [Amanita polypyramis BW_CC]
MNPDKYILRHHFKATISDDNPPPTKYEHALTYNHHDKYVPRLLLIPLFKQHPDTSSTIHHKCHPSPSSDSSSSLVRNELELTKVLPKQNDFTTITCLCFKEKCISNRSHCIHQTTSLHRSIDTHSHSWRSCR